MDDFEEETQAGLAKRPPSAIPHTLRNRSLTDRTGILPLELGNSQEEGRIPTIFPQTSGEFLFMWMALESAHNEDNGWKKDLLLAIHNFIWRLPRLPRRKVPFLLFKRHDFTLAKSEFGTLVQIQPDMGNNGNEWPHQGPNYSIRRSLTLV